jgi:hypothetical protein
LIFFHQFSLLLKASLPPPALFLHTQHFVWEQSKSNLLREASEGRKKKKKKREKIERRKHLNKDK